MTTNAVYQKIKDETPTQLDKLVLEILSDHVGKKSRITRKFLVGVVSTRLMDPHANPQTFSTIDRMVRHSIEKLQERGYPICSDSGTGGYWLATTYAEREDYIAEIESRANVLMSKARKLRKANNIIWNEPQVVTQLTLLKS